MMTARWNSLCLGLTISALLTPVAVAEDAGSASYAAWIVQSTEQVECASEELREQIKCHLKGAPNYRLMLIKNTQVKMKAAAIHRRVCRDACYRGLDRDVAKLFEHVCNLERRYSEMLMEIQQCPGCCTPAGLACVEQALANVSAWARSVCQPPVDVGYPVPYGQPVPAMIAPAIPMAPGPLTAPGEAVDPPSQTLLRPESTEPTLPQSILEPPAAPEAPAETETPSAPETNPSVQSNSASLELQGPGTLHSVVEDGEPTEDDAPGSAPVLEVSPAILPEDSSSILDR